MLTITKSNSLLVEMLTQSKCGFNSFLYFYDLRSLTLNIQQKDDGKHGAFEMYDHDALAGEMVYTWAGEKLFIIDQTDVADDYRGQGVGRKLLDAVVDFARNNQIKIIPLCPYAKSVFDKDPSIRDVLRDA